jgi:hypothetical protein
LNLILKTKTKGWPWALTWPFAHNNFTTIWKTLYCPKGSVPSNEILRHEKIHSDQQRRWTLIGLPLWLFLYLGTRYTWLVFAILAFGLPETLGDMLWLSPALILGLPVLWNPFRKRWEMEAYVKGSGYTESRAKAILWSYRYGWLL